MSRKRFLYRLTLLIVLVIASSLTVAILFGWQMQKDISADLLKRGASTGEERLVEFFQRGEQLLRVLQKWGTNQGLGQRDQTDLDRKFLPVLEENRKLSALILGDESGSYYRLLHDKAGWTSTRLNRRTPNSRISVQTWQEGNSAPVTLDTRPMDDYDPRNRPWFQRAQQTSPGVVSWVGPYQFWSTKQLGVTGAIRWQEGAAMVTGAIDIQLQDIIDFLQNLKLTPNSDVFLLNVDGNNVKLLQPEAEHSSILRQAIVLWQNANLTSDQPFSFKHQNETWWTGFHRLKTKNQSIWLGVLIPETDISGAMPARQRTIFLVLGAILTFGLWLGWSMVRRYSSQVPLVTDGATTMSPTELKALIAQGEGPTLEFKSTVRMNLASGKPGKEIELAWLKAVVAFMNSQGGSLMIGVTDSGEVCGLTADNFQNDDKCLLHFKNLLHQHIGPEFSQYLHFSINTIDEKQILVVHCNPANEPAFLKVNKDDEFFIRSGPSNIRLSTSQVLKYLESRK